MMDDEGREAMDITKEQLNAMWDEGEPVKVAKRRKKKRKVIRSTATVSGDLRVIKVDPAEAKRLMDAGASIADIVQSLDPIATEVVSHDEATAKAQASVGELKAGERAVLQSMYRPAQKRSK